MKKKAPKFNAQEYWKSNPDLQESVKALTDRYVSEIDLLFKEKAKDIDVLVDLRFRLKKLKSIITTTEGE